MKKSIFLLISLIISVTFFDISATDYLSPSLTRIYPTDNPACRFEIIPSGKDVLVKGYNIIPYNWKNAHLIGGISMYAEYDRKNNHLTLKIITGSSLCWGGDTTVYETAPYFDATFKIPNLEHGVYELDYSIAAENCRIVSGSTALILNGNTIPLKGADTEYQIQDIVREGVEWVLHNPIADDGSEFYRMQFKGKADLFYPGDGETVRDAMKLYLYTNRELDDAEDPVIAYFLPYGPMNARRIAANVDIPIGFWGSWKLGLPPSRTINPFKTFGNPDEILRITPIMEETFTVSQLPEEEKMDAKWYWEDYLTGTMRPMFKQAYIDETGDSGTQRYALTMSENMDGTGYQGRWESGIGPVGDDYASNLPYPIYSLPKGVEPTRLLYVRDINTNEILWGDPGLDPAYNAVGEITAEPVSEVYGGDGVIEVRGEGNLKIYTLSGVLAGSVDAPATVAVAPGVYIAVSGTQSKKIIVR